MVAEQCGRRLAQAYTRRARARLPLPEQTPAALIQTCVIASRGAQAENEIQVSRIQRTQENSTCNIHYQNQLAFRPGSYRWLPH